METNNKGQENVLDTAGTESDVKPTNVLNELFKSHVPGSSFGGANQLQATARLTTIASDIANDVWQQVLADPEEFSGKIQGSQQSHDAMDDLINELYNLGSVDVSFLPINDEDEIEKMIRSQQSKRSRAKSKVMTQENYITMLVGAVAENLLRVASGKYKSAGGGAVMGDIGFSAEDLEALAVDTEDLKKAIRNVQSKKSIMKAKADFNPMSNRWLQLLAAEQQLKEVRDRGSFAQSEEAKKAIETQKAAEELLANVNTNELKADEAKELLEKMKEMLASK